MATILPGLEIGERYMKAQVSSIHKLYTVKKKKKKNSRTVAKVCRAYRNAVWGPL